VTEPKTWTMDDLSKRFEVLKKKFGRLGIEESPDHPNQWYFSCSKLHAHMYTRHSFYFWNRNGED
jgi:hypothetical protein